MVISAIRELMHLFVMVWKGVKDTDAKWKKKSVQFKEVQHECKLTYINSIKSDEMCSKVSLSEVQIFKAEKRRVILLPPTPEFKLRSGRGNVYVLER